MEDLVTRFKLVSRFRHRSAYGVHSPSDLITFVIYEQAPYYRFASLHHLRRVVSHLPHYREKVDRSRFRLELIIWLSLTS